MKPYQRFKRKHKVAHLAIVATAIVMMWWAIWGILDIIFLPVDSFTGYALAFIFAFAILYLDDFHLKELR